MKGQIIDGKIVAYGKITGEGLIDLPDDYTPERYDYVDGELVYISDYSEHLNKLELAVDNHVNRVLLDHWYIDIGEVSALANFENRWQDEAIALRAWYALVYKSLEDYKLNISHDTMQDIDEFINNLPVFEYV